MDERGLRFKQGRGELRLVFLTVCLKKTICSWGLAIARLKFLPSTLCSFNQRPCWAKACRPASATSFPFALIFLDTMGGGNLSLQVHPLTSYIQEGLGIHYTQDESYYVLDLHVLNLVEGREAVVESPAGAFEPFAVHYAETFIVPAGVGAYTVRPYGESEEAEYATIKAYIRF